MGLGYVHLKSMTQYRSVEMNIRAQWKTVIDARGNTAALRRSIDKNNISGIRLKFAKQKRESEQSEIIKRNF